MEEEVETVVEAVVTTSLSPLRTGRLSVREDGSVSEAEPEKEVLGVVSASDSVSGVSVRTDDMDDMESDGS